MGGTVASLGATTMRTHRCGELRAAHDGQRVRLGGWVHRRRDLGGLVFIDLRDREGLVQVAFAPEAKDAYAAASALTQETVVLVEGTVALRPAGQSNKDMPTGDVEVRGTALQVVGPAQPPAIPVALGKGESLASEELRLRHRHLDLRRHELYANLELRHRLLQQARRTLTELGFLEVETPILTKPTPEGARDYLVPSRLYPGEFYALPQSPQIYKQLLMVAGFDRYFQMCRCFRDEDLRADRQPEFSQIDIEASFIGPEDVYAVIERVLVDQWAVAGHQVTAPFPRMGYHEAMAKYGTDKPDLRFGLEIQDVTARIGEGSGDFLKAAVGRGDTVRVIAVPGGAALSRKDFDQLTEDAKTMRASGLLWAKKTAEGITGPGAKALGEAAFAGLNLADGDAVVGCAGPEAIVLAALGRVRLAVAKRLPQHSAPSTISAGSKPSRCSRRTPTPGRGRRCITRSRRPCRTISDWWRPTRTGHDPPTTTSCTTAMSWAAAASASWTRRSSRRCSTSSGSRPKRPSTVSASCWKACGPARRRTAAWPWASTAS